MDHLTMIDIDGMTCANCVAHVSEELEQVPGATSPVRVVSDQELDDQALRAAVDEAGYTVAAISR